MKRMLSLLAAAVVVAAGVVAGFSAAPAAAFSVSSSGCQGSIQVPRILGYQPGPSFQFPARTASRSPCYSSYTQVIKVHYRLWGYDHVAHQWINFAWTDRTGTVPPGYQLTFNAWGGLLVMGDISGDVLVEWRLTNGYLIGSTYINYDAIGDYSCLTLACSVYSDPNVGAYIHFG